jgi:hypothetical protein
MAPRYDIFNEPTPKQTLKPHRHSVTSLKTAINAALTTEQKAGYNLDTCTLNDLWGIVRAHNITV